MKAVYGPPLKAPVLQELCSCHRHKQYSRHVAGFYKPIHAYSKQFRMTTAEGNCQRYTNQQKKTEEETCNAWQNKQTCNICGRYHFQV